MLEGEEKADAEMETEISKVGLVRGKVKSFVLCYDEQGIPFNHYHYRGGKPGEESGAAEVELGTCGGGGRHQGGRVRPGKAGRPARLAAARQGRQHRTSQH
eukprot:GFUD01044662.1.p1 GENE.GFUD01044662.1~~GFUD01044662.1.p1  ORF type:complete len:101 (-),score=20.66 GFUD01044662.1:90-392(-)